MKKKLLILLTILVAIFLGGCHFKSNVNTKYELTEGIEIQETLDFLSSSVLSMDIETYMSCFSSDCSFLNIINEGIISFKSRNISLKSFSTDIVSLKRYGEGITASIKIQWEVIVEGKKKSGSGVKDVYFSKENDTWKIEDYFFHYYSHPCVVVGNSSLLSFNAQSMANALDSELSLDINHLQSSGDIILLGTAYDNASILEMEKKNSTYVNVTEDYPGGELGIVQVIPNVENYRHAILIQGSSLQSAKNSIDFMTQYLGEHKYMEPGVYFIKNNKIRKAELLELTSLTTLDYNKANETLTRAQNIIEYNIKLISDEISLEKDNINLIAKNISNKYKKDYKEAFTLAAASKSEFQPINMGVICSYFIDKDICARAFSLPASRNVDALYSASMFAKDMDISAMTALLRLAAYQGDEVFNLEGDGVSTVFANIGEGYVLDFDIPFILGVSRQYSIGEFKSMENDGLYINLKENSSNMPKEDIINSINTINKAYDLKKELLQSKIVRKDLSQHEGISNTLIPFSILDIYEKLQSNTPYYESITSSSSVGEAKEALRKAMGELLSIKCSKYILNLAGKYPRSQYDYSRYSRGLAFVEHPRAYLEAARESSIIKTKASEIGSSNKERENKIEGILSLLSAIKIQEETGEFFLKPEICLEAKKGKAMDKALLAYGLYSNMFSKLDDVWVAVGENSSYLVIKDEYGYSCIDCKYDALSRIPEPSIYLCFNEKYTYYAKMRIGEKPEFVK